MQYLQRTPEGCGKRQQNHSSSRKKKMTGKKATNCRMRTKEQEYWRKEGLGVVWTLPTSLPRPPRQGQPYFPQHGKSPTLQLGAAWTVPVGLYVVLGFQTSLLTSLYFPHPKASSKSESNCTEPRDENRLKGYSLNLLLLSSRCRLP